MPSLNTHACGRACQSRGVRKIRSSWACVPNSLVAGSSGAGASAGKEILGVLLSVALQGIYGTSVQPYLLLRCQLPCFLCSCPFSFSSALVPLLLLPPCFLVFWPAHAACFYAILRPQLEHATSEKTAAWNLTRMQMGREVLA